MAKVSNNPFLHQERYGRFFGGGKGEMPLDPYTSGYHFVFFWMPDELTKYIASRFNEDREGMDSTPAIEAKDVPQLLSIHNLALTPPTVTLNKTTMNGIGGTKWQVPTNLDIGDTISARYNEYSGLPIYMIHKYWVQAFHNQYLGIAHSGQYENSSGDIGLRYQEDYKAVLYYAAMRPDMKNIEFCAKFSGVFPTKIPDDSFASDLATADKVEIDMEYHVDFMYDNDPAITSTIQTLINTSRDGGIANNVGRANAKSE